MRSRNGNLSVHFGNGQRKIAETCRYLMIMDFKIGVSLPLGGQALIDRGAANLHN